MAMSVIVEPKFKQLAEEPKTSLSSAVFAHRLAYKIKGTSGSIYCTQGRGGGPLRAYQNFWRSKYYCKMCLENSLDVLHKSPQSLLGLHLPDCVNNMLQLAT